MQKLLVYLVSTLLVFGLLTCEKTTEPNEPPTCVVTSPGDSAEIERGEVATITVDAEDEDGEIEELEFWGDHGIISENMFPSFPFNYEWDTKDVELGGHYIGVEVWDDDEASSGQKIRVFVVSSEPINNEMIFIEGGNYTMGDVWGDGFGDETPTHEVKVSSFYMSKYEVTHEEYIEFLNSRGVTSDGSYNGNELIDIDCVDCAIAHDGSSFYFGRSSYAQVRQCPVIYVTWYGAVEYCNWLSEQEGLAKAYTISSGSVKCDWNANGYRLPTEAEWEYAARSGGRDDRKWSGTDSESELGDYAWYDPNSGSETHPVGTKQPNDLGIYDMSGNVWEWCWDWYNSGYYSDSPSNNPTGSVSGWYRVIRGGVWYHDADYCRTVYRINYPPSQSNRGLGFRLTRSQ